MKSKKTKSKIIKLFIFAVCIGLLSTIASIFLSKNNSNSELNTQLETYSNNRSINDISDSEISNDFNQLGDSFNIWNTNQNDIFNQSLKIGSSAKKFQFHTQLEIIDAVIFWSINHYNNWIVNSLNTLDSGINQLNYSKNLNLSSILNNTINNSIDSVWMNDATTNAPFIYKQTFGGGKFNPPNRTGNNDSDLNKTQNLYGPSIYSNLTRKWNYFSIGGDTGAYYFNQKMFDINNPQGAINGKEQIKYLSNKNYWINQVKNNFETHSFNIKNNSFCLDELIYKVNSNPITISQDIFSFGNYDVRKAKFRIFDSTEQNSKLIRNRSVDNWYKNNYVDWVWNQNESTPLGINQPNKINKVSSMWVDFKNLIQVDEDATTSYSINGNTNTSTNAPVLKFGWNLELFGALKEAKLLAEYVRSFFDNWTSIINFSNGVKNSFINLVNDIYNEKVGIEIVQNFVNQIRSTNGVKDNYTPSTTKANYALILEKNNWDLQKTSGTINSVGFSNVIQTISNWALPYDYVLPQIFKNDIYVNYKIEGSDNWNVNELNTKIFDGSSKSWLPLQMIDYGVQKQNYNNDISMWIKNFYMKDINTGDLIASKNTSLNSTLNETNIYNLSKNKTKTKIAWDSSQQALKVTWKWNPGLQQVNQVNTGTKTKALDTPWYFASQAIIDPNVLDLSKKAWADLTQSILKIPNNNNYNPINIILSFVFDLGYNSSNLLQYQDLQKSSKLFEKLVKYYDKPTLIQDSQYWNIRRELDELGYFYLPIYSSIPLNYYLTDAEYDRLQNDNTFINLGTKNGYYKYFVKYSFKAKPLKLSNLEKYLRISWTSSDSKNPKDLYTNKKLTVSFNTKQMKQDLANLIEIDQSYFTLTTNQLNEFFDYSYDDFWNAVIDLINQKTGVDWKLTPDCFRFQSDGTNLVNPIDTNKVVSEQDNWFYTSRWNYLTNSNTTFSNLTFNCNLDVKYKNTNVDELNNYVTVSSGDVEISQFAEVNQQLNNSKNIETQINDLRTQLNLEQSNLSKIDLKIKQKQLEIKQLIRDEISKSEFLKNKFDEIEKKYSEQVSNIINDIKRRYEIFKSDNKYVSNGFVSSTLNKTFNYKNDLERLKSLFESMNNEINSLLNDKNLKDQIKTKIDESIVDLRNELNSIQINISNLENQLSELVKQNTNLDQYVEQINKLDSNQTITLKFNTNNILLLSNADNESGLWGDLYWAYKLNSSQNYKSIINKNEFISKLQEIVNSTFSSILGMNLEITKEMFELKPNQTVLTGFVNDKYSNKVQTTSVHYQIDSTNRLTKLELVINVQDKIDLSRIYNPLDEIKKTLKQIKNQVDLNSFEFTNLNELINNSNSNLSNNLNLLNEFGNVDLPNIFGSSQQAANIQKQIDNYQDIKVNKTKLNDAFIGTLVASIIVGLLLIVGLGIFLNSLRRNKAKKFSQQEIDEINKVAEEFKNNNKE